MRRTPLNFPNFLLLFILTVNMQGQTSSSDISKPNILFIIVDDLRPELGCYGSDVIKSPNIDKLASEGLIFNNSYCNFPVCGPSRASIFSGIRPNATIFTSNKSSLEKDVPDITPMPNFFKNNGYTTISLGKIYHHRYDQVDGWTEKPWHPIVDENKEENPDKWRDYLTDENLELCRNSKKGIGNSWEMADVEDTDYFDGKISNKAIQYLEEFKNSKAPFFMSVGFIKPHLPFNAPKKYFDIYPEGTLKMPENYFAPENVPSQAMHNWWELRAYQDILSKEGLLNEQQALELKRAYYACISYVDAMIGNVLNSLEELDLAENTIVCLIGDHGWQLGEHTLWAKHSNFNNALRVPVIMKVPGKKTGQCTDALVELIDLYPTFCELTGFSAPEFTEGQSIVPLLDKPKSEWKEVVYAKMANAWSVKTQKYLYTEWIAKNGNITDSMLYNHEIDPKENTNLIGMSEYNKDITKLKHLLYIYQNQIPSKSNNTLNTHK